MTFSETCTKCNILVYIRNEDIMQELNRSLEWQAERWHTAMCKEHLEKMPESRQDAFLEKNMRFVVCFISQLSTSLPYPPPIFIENFNTVIVVCRIIPSIVFEPINQPLSDLIASFSMFFPSFPTSLRKKSFQQHFKPSTCNNVQTRQYHLTLSAPTSSKCNN